MKKTERLLSIQQLQLQELLFTPTKTSIYVSVPADASDLRAAGVIIWHRSLVQSGVVSPLEPKSFFK